MQSTSQPPVLSRRSMLAGVGAAAAGLLTSTPAHPGPDPFNEPETLASQMRVLLGSYIGSVLALHFKTLDLPDTFLAEMISDRPGSATAALMVSEIRKTGSDAEGMILQGVKTMQQAAQLAFALSLSRLSNGLGMVVPMSTWDWVYDRPVPVDRASSPVLRALVVLSKPILRTDYGMVTYCSGSPVRSADGAAFSQAAYADFLGEAGLWMIDGRLPPRGSPRLADAAPQDPALKELFVQHLDTIISLRRLTTLTIYEGLRDMPSLAGEIERNLGQVIRVQAQAADYIVQSYPAYRNQLSPDVVTARFSPSSTLTLPPRSAMRSPSFIP